MHRRTRVTLDTLLHDQLRRRVGGDGVDVMVDVAVRQYLQRQHEWEQLLRGDEQSQTIGTAQR